MRRVGLGRRGRIGTVDGAGDPLEGVVNLFDVGIVLAAAALIAALGASGARERDAAEQPAPRPLAAPPRDAPKASGSGTAVGTVYRLPDGRLVLVERGRGAAAGP